jgi:hypothetical protein
VSGSKVRWPLTKKEASAVRRLKRLAEDWPETLWLYSAGGNLHVMQTDENGDAAMGAGFRGEGVDPEYDVLTINIPNDGGDW